MRIIFGKVRVIEKSSPVIYCKIPINDSEMPAWYKVVNRKTGGSFICTEHDVQEAADRKSVV